ncbi:hypothetical protein CN105_12545 [Sinorhizobium meliloti]|nr:hypothetical protein CN105_12545 [Sinorhizobium meliloti]
MDALSRVSRHRRQGETPSRHIHVRGLAQAPLLADLPLCGGDARQGRGGMSPHPPFTKQHTFRASLTAPRR